MGCVGPTDDLDPDGQVHGDPIASPGEARRAIYLPAYAALIKSWLDDADVRACIAEARVWPGHVLLRDWGTGRGVDRNGPMSHAWVLATWLNANKF
jgi:hypothetical protein